MGEDKEHRRGARKGITLLRALVATFKWRIALAGLLMIGDSGVHIAQVGAVPGIGARESERIIYVYMFFGRVGLLHYCCRFFFFVWVVEGVVLAGEARAKKRAR